LNITALGEMAALGAACMWSVSPVIFTIAGRRVGAMVVNRMRLLLATFLILCAHWLFVGQPFPLDVEPSRLFWLGLSGIVGFVVADGLFFQGLILIGTRLSLLLVALAPVFGTAMAWAFLGETLTTPELVGMGLAICGVTWVVLEGRATAADRGVSEHKFLLGVLCCLGAALLAGVSLVTAKLGLADDFPALSAAVISLAAAMVTLWTITILRSQVRPTLDALRADRRAVLLISAGTCIGPVLGFWLSLIALQTIRVGIASTLMSMNPIFTLPVVRLVFGEKITRRALLGTLVAMTGVVLLILI
jgi:drug/metabolite transporter (DMT)-like permease